MIMGKLPTTVFCWTLIVTISFFTARFLIADSQGYDEEKLDQVIDDAAKEHGMDPSSSMVYKPPIVSDEERGSKHMPKHLRCAACSAVAHQLELAFKKALKSVKAGGRLSLADQIDVVETVCEKRLHGYGLKEVHGKKLLSGPGLGAENFPGITEGGGKWEARLKILCLELVEEFEEDGIYDLYEDSKAEELWEGLCVSYCNKSPDKNKNSNSQDGSTHLEKEEL